MCAFRVPLSQLLSASYCLLTRRVLAPFIYPCIYSSPGGEEPLLVLSSTSVTCGVHEVVSLYPGIDKKKAISNGEN